MIHLRDGFTVVFIIFLAFRCPPSCYCSSVKASDPISPAPSFSPHTEDTLYTHRAALFAYKDLFSLKSGPELCSQLLLIVAGDSHMPEHREHLKASPSSADGRPPWRNVFTAQRVLPCWLSAHVQPLVRLAQGGETGLNTPCYRLRLSASAEPLPGSRGRKTIMHCLPSSFSPLPRSDTGESCLADSGTVLSSNRPQSLHL